MSVHGTRRRAALAVAVLALALVPRPSHATAEADANADPDAVVAARHAAMRAGTSPAELYHPAREIGRPDSVPMPRAFPGIDGAALERISAWAEAQGRGVLLMWHRGALVFRRGYGGADPDDAFDAFSMHKTLVALLVGRAIADGAIPSVDARASEWLPEWRDDARATITLRDLLRMNGGLERQRLVESPPWNAETRMLLGDDVWTEALARGAAHPPGADFHYANVETQVLGIVLERATGTPYADYLERVLWDPLGAGRARLWLDAHERPRAYCCFLSRAEDWIRVGRLFLDRGTVGGRRIVPAAWIDEMTTPQPLNPGYGYQLWLGGRGEEVVASGAGSAFRWSEPMAAPPVLRLLGFNGQRTYVLPRCQLVIVRMGERAADWDETFLPNLVARGIGEGCVADPAAP